MGLNVPSMPNGAENNSTNNGIEDECLQKELHETLIPTALRVPWTDDEAPLYLHFYYIRFVPIPDDRKYMMFGLFVKNPLPREAETMDMDLHLHHSRIVKTSLVPSGVIKFDRDEIILAEKFQEMSLKVILDRSFLFPDFVPLGETSKSYDASSTFYLLLPVKLQNYSDDKRVDWETVKRCLASHVFGNSPDPPEGLHPMSDSLKLNNGSFRTYDVLNSLVFTPHNKKYFFVHAINHDKNVKSYKSEKYATYEAYYKERRVQLLYPEQPFLVAKQLPNLHNLLIDRAHKNKEVQELKEYFEEFPPELCVLKIMGFSKDIGSSLTLLPSLMHHVQNLLVAIELKDMLSTSIPEVSEIRAYTVLQALTTQKCSARFSLERLEVLGDAFLKYVVGHHCFLSHPALDEGQLTVMRSAIVNNLNLYELAIKSNLQMYIRDEMFQPSQFYALGRPCKKVCSVDTELIVHSDNKKKNMVGGREATDVTCTKSHRWLSRKTIADTVEALAGAFLVESGFAAAISFLRWIGIQVNFGVSDVQTACVESKNNQALVNVEDVAALERLIGYSFKNRGLLMQAFVHSSYHNQTGGCYQRLEFLGDAALEYLVTSYIYSVYPELNPGQITDLKSAVVNNKSFAYIAVARSFHLYLRHNSCALTEAINKFSRYVQVSDSEIDILEEPACPKILGDIIESSIGAILVDTGFNLRLVWKTMLGLLEPALDFSRLQMNHVRELRELCQSVDLTLELHKPSKVMEGYLMCVEVYVKGKRLTFGATNHNSKAAQRMAAQKALSKLKALGYKHKRRTLQEIVQSSRKEAAQLIGFDEEPMLVRDANSSSKVSRQDVKKTHPKLSQKPEKTPPPSLLSHDHEKMPSKLNIGKKTDDSPNAKTRLYEICAANRWERPLFVLYKEEGPSHMKMFTFKVIVKVEGISKADLECYGEPRQQKKAAQENAAEGAVWYLNHLGYLPEA